jgi:thiol-disulfide isomerase/thioredoxin
MPLQLTSSRAQEPLVSHGPVWVICLCADWCGVCREYRAIFERVASQFPLLRFAWLDVEDEAALVGDLDIETFPTLLIATSQGARFMGALTPHANTLSRLLDALEASSDDGSVVLTPFNLSALLQTLQASPQFWVKN